MARAGDTIFALSSGPGRAAVAVFRLSGPGAAAAIERLSGAAPGTARQAVLRLLREPRRGEAIDRGLVLWFPAPARFTGEDMAEFQVHGGRAVAAAMVEALAAVEGVRPAEPGEFSRRAFEHGRLDLTEAEGIADLVAAETAAQRRQALRQADGALSELYETWRRGLIEASARVEVEIDFSDEDLPENLSDAVRPYILRVCDEIAQHLDDDHRGERLRDGFYVAIVGPPNAGKSSLLNRLAGRDAAIVSALAGTTRDVIEVHLDLGGYPLILADTAGLRESLDAIESEAVRRALARAEAADLKLLVFDGASWPALDPATAALIDQGSVVVVNKADLIDGCRLPDLEAAAGLLLSCKTGAGMAELVEILTGAAQARIEPAATPALTRARHRAALEDCRDALTRFCAGGAHELAAENLRLAVRAVGRVTGRVDVEEILDVVFRDFCIGK